MTVSTVVAGLLPIMWSTRVGAEVMKPLATPVLGGMVSSLLHVLVVTPVIFFWIQERRLGLANEPLTERPQRRVRWRPVLMAVGLLLTVAVAGLMWRQARRGETPVTSGAGTVVQRVNANGLQIALLSPTGGLHLGRNAFSIEFRSTGGALVDAGAVRLSANMPMPGMVMSGGVQVQRTSVTGLYDATAEFGMAGAWHMAIEWDGPAGRGSANFEGAVQ
jgi:Cu(I)/Ag(I) efflux system membrane protein CusA/SilA